MHHEQRAGAGEVKPPQIVDAAEVKQRPRKAPATRMIEQIPDGLMTARDLSVMFDVNIETIRRLARAKNSDGSDKFIAPSKAAKQGELIIWVYTPADVEELAEYFGKKIPKPRKGTKGVK
jgi:hypothetical protein